MVSLTLSPSSWSRSSGPEEAYGGGPGGAVLVASSHEDDHPEEGHDEAEDGDKHHPSQGVGRAHVGGRHQDPHQTAEHLKHASHSSPEKQTWLH